MKCILMNQNTEVMTLEYDENAFNKITEIYEIINIEYAPLSLYNAYNNKSKNLLKEMVDWFKVRGIPSYRKDLDMLIYNLSSPYDISKLFNKYYGLSLSDQYWLKPVDSDVKWKDINFFEHDFDGEKFLDASLFPLCDKEFSDGDLKIPSVTTNGMLPKGWIIENNKRILVKSTYEFANQEPFNEWLASEICSRLSFDYCPYYLDLYKGKLVSKCENFLTKDEEILTACDIFDLKKKSNNISEMDHYLSILEENGIENAREQFENMLILDFLMLNKDRHMRNYGVIRNVKTLKWERLIPIFDTGQSMNCDKMIKSMSFIDETGKFFYNTHKPFSTYLKLIKDISRIDISKLDGILDDYKSKLMEYKDKTYISDERINKLVNGLKLRISLLNKFINQNPPTSTSSTNLPPYLQHDIDEYVKCKDDLTCTHLDCLLAELYGSINAAYSDGEISKEEADALRDKYYFKGLKLLAKRAEYKELLKFKKTSMDRPYYDYTIDFDTSVLPKSLADEILAMEIADQNSDWMKYDYHLSSFEASMKNAVIKQKVSENDFDILMNKYGGC